MAEIEIRQARDGDADALLSNLREQDRIELEALMGPGAERETLQKAMRDSSLMWVGTVDGEVACMFGVVPVSLLGGQGVPWLLGTPLIDKNRGAFIKRNRAYIARMLDACPHLVNIVDARNIKSIAWLKRMGFVIHDARPWGRSGEPFHLFTMDA